MLTCFKSILKISIPTIYNLAVIYPWNLLFSSKIAYFLTVSIVFSVYKQIFMADWLLMPKFQCLLFVLKRSYICYYIICITVPLMFYLCFIEEKVIFITDSFLLFTNISFKMLEFNPLYYKKKPCVKISFDLAFFVTW